MAWISITEDLVKTRLTGPELSALKSAALAAGQTGVLDDVIRGVILEWRGCLRRWHPMGAGQTLPDELLHHTLAMIRYRLFTRLPGMKALLDDLRVKEYEAAQKAQGNLQDMSFEAPETPDTSTSGTPAPAFDRADREFGMEEQSGL